jgi:putative zinc finger protein
MTGRNEINAMNCRDVRELADSFLSEELLTETNHDILRHVESCVSCRNEIATRRQLRAGTQGCVRSGRGNCSLLTN